MNGVNLLKYQNTTISMQEVPGEISMIFEISGCPHRCEGCHSLELWRNEGGFLTVSSLSLEIKKYENFISCVCFFGGEWEEKILIELLSYCQEKGYKTCLYTGATDVSLAIKSRLSFLKIGPWVEKLGGLDSVITNQKFINLSTGECLNYLFQNTHTKKQGENYVETEFRSNFGKN